MYRACNTVSMRPTVIIQFGEIVSLNKVGSVTLFQPSLLWNYVWRSLWFSLYKKLYIQYVHTSNMLQSKKHKYKKKKLKQTHIFITSQVFVPYKHFGKDRRFQKDI
jgi:hypothetical protein